MPNWSGNRITFWGSVDNISAADECLKTFFIEGDYIGADDLMSDDSADQRTVYQGGELLHYSHTSNNITIAINGRWSGPSGLFVLLVDMFDLSGTYVDREQGYNFTHVIKAEYGEITFDEVEDFISDLAFQHESNVVMMSALDYIFYEDENAAGYEDVVAICERNGLSFDTLKSFHKTG